MGSRVVGSRPVDAGELMRRLAALALLLAALGSGCCVRFPEPSSNQKPPEVVCMAIGCPGSAGIK